MKKLIVTNNPKNFAFDIPGVEIVSAKNYLTSPEFAKLRKVRVFNLSNEYRYQSKGYYVSLLAEARGHKPIPSVKIIQDIKTPTIIRTLSDDLDDLIQKSFKNIKTKEFTLSIYFGKNVAVKYSTLCAELYKLFPVPFQRAKFTYSKKWTLVSLKPISYNEIDESHLSYVKEFALEYFSKKRYDKSRSDNWLYDLAILVNPEEKSPPSDKKALSRFIDAAEASGFYTELITREDLSRIGEFDALFIRATTFVNHFTYRFSSKAQSEGLIVIDDPDSILRCTNKVYLAEALLNANIPMPKTVIIHADNKKDVLDSLGLPCVLKLPDSAFSLGVTKIEKPEELVPAIEKMLSSSDLVIAQEFLPTDFDWRIGILDGKVIYACKYFMANDHWQIYNWSSTVEKEVAGGHLCVPPEDVPEQVIEYATRAANLMGKGLYGVDVKESEGKVYIIEVNDNPSIDSGIEDSLSGNELYKTIIGYFRQQIEARLNRDKNHSLNKQDAV